MDPARIIEHCYYENEDILNHFKQVPGLTIANIVDLEIEDSDVFFSLQNKIQTTCRKLCMGWIAGRKALEVESNFYGTYCMKDAPVLYGEHEVNLHYHLEAMILFFRSALDVISPVFSSLLPPPFKKARYDSFNKLTKKTISAYHGDIFFTQLEQAKDDPASVISTLCGVTRGRALRDKIVHQTGFPIEYEDIGPHTEKRHAVVNITKEDSMPLIDFVDHIRLGTINLVIDFENHCCELLSTHQQSNGEAHLSCEDLK